MNNQYIRLLLAVILCVVTSCSTTRQLPVRETEGKDKREFRGAWIQTAFQGEYKDMTPAQMRKDFVRKLNYLQSAGINASFSRSVPKRTRSINRTSNPGAASIPASRVSLLPAIST